VRSRSQLGISDDFQKLFGFTLNVEESSVPDAGEGVKLRGAASIGSLVVRWQLAVLKLLMSSSHRDVNFNRRCIPVSSTCQSTTRR
jgi:hypothetical protein